eukprot:scaffold363_cov331-Pavlova_lutheri.AAC.11
MLVLLLQAIGMLLPSERNALLVRLLMPIDLWAFAGEVVLMFPVRLQLHASVALLHSMLVFVD